MHFIKENALENVVSGMQTPGVYGAVWVEWCQICLGLNKLTEYGMMQTTLLL